MKIRLMCCCLALCLLSCRTPFLFAEVAGQESIVSTEPEPPPTDDAEGLQERTVVLVFAEPQRPSFPAVELFASFEFDDVGNP